MPFLCLLWAAFLCLLCPTLYYSTWVLNFTSPAPSTLCLHLCLYRSEEGHAGGGFLLPGAWNLPILVPSLSLCCCHSAADRRSRHTLSGTGTASFASMMSRFDRLTFLPVVCAAAVPYTDDLYRASPGRLTHPLLVWCISFSRVRTFLRRTLAGA